MKQKMQQAIKQSPSAIKIIIKGIRRTTENCEADQGERKQHKHKSGPAALNNPLTTLQLLMQKAAVVCCLAADEHVVIIDDLINGQLIILHKKEDRKRCTPMRNSIRKLTQTGWQGHQLTQDSTLWLSCGKVSRLNLKQNSRQINQR